MNDLFITYQNALKDFGEPQGGPQLPSTSLDAYRGRIPDSFLDFMICRPLGKWLRGYFQFCDPDEYRSILTMILSKDRELDPQKTHILGFSAFGDIIAWNEDHKTVELNILYGRVSCPNLFSPEPDTEDGITLGIVIGGVDAVFYDPPDKDGKPMFKRALKMHGELEFGQIYAPKLHPALGGSITVENLRPANALAAMTIAAQAGPFTLYDTTKPSVPAVRYIGE